MNGPTKTVILTSAVTSLATMCVALVLTTSLTVWADNDNNPGTADLPSTINYSGDLDWDGVPYNGDVNMRFSLYPTPSSPDALWTETQSLSARRGRFAAELGSVLPLEEVVLDAGTVFLGVEVQRPEDDAFVTLGNRQKLNPVPYAIHASNASDLNVAGTLTAGHIDHFEIVGPFRLANSVTMNLPSASNHACYLTQTYIFDATGSSNANRHGCIIYQENGLWKLSRATGSSQDWCGAHCLKFNP